MVDSLSLIYSELWRFQIPEFALFRNSQVTVSSGYPKLLLKFENLHIGRREIITTLKNADLGCIHERDITGGTKKDYPRFDNAEGVCYGHWKFGDHCPEWCEYNTNDNNKSICAVVIKNMVTNVLRKNSPNGPNLCYLHGYQKQKCSVRNITGVAT